MECDKSGLDLKYYQNNTTESIVKKTTGALTC